MFEWRQGESVVVVSGSCQDPFSDPNCSGVGRIDVDGL